MVDNVEDNFFINDIETISYRGDNFDLLQRHKKSIET